MSKRISREVNAEAGAVTFTVTESGASLTCALAELPDDVKVRLMLHGLNAKVGDSAADKNTDALEKMTGVWDSLKAGEWTQRGGGESGPRITILAEALARVRDRTVEDAVAYLADQDEEKVKAIRKVPEIEAAMKAIRAERAAAAAKAASKAAKGAESDLSSIDF